MYEVSRSMSDLFCNCSVTRLFCHLLHQKQYGHKKQDGGRAVSGVMELPRPWCPGQSRDDSGRSGFKARQLFRLFCGELLDARSEAGRGGDLHVGAGLRISRCKIRRRLRRTAPGEQGPGRPRGLYVVGAHRLLRKGSFQAGPAGSRPPPHLSPPRRGALTLPLRHCACARPAPASPLLGACADPSGIPLRFPSRPPTPHPFPPLPWRHRAAWSVPCTAGPSVR